MKKSRHNYIKCPTCEGRGFRVGGTSKAQPDASTWECECCYGSGQIHKDTNPDWWKTSDNEIGGR